MKSNGKKGKHKIAKALLGIYEAKHIDRKDQLLYQKTLFDLEKEAEAAPEEQKSKRTSQKTDTPRVKNS
jgi:hypothetical protein